MTTKNMSLPDELKIWIDAISERYPSPDDYLSEIVRREQKRRAAIAELQRLVDEGFASGISTRTIEEIFADARGQARQRDLIDV